VHPLARSGGHGLRTLHTHSYNTIHTSIKPGGRVGLMRSPLVVSALARVCARPDVVGPAEAARSNNSSPLSRAVTGNNKGSGVLMMSSYSQLGCRAHPLFPSSYLP
jgi:hypothetical protein